MLSIIICYRNKDLLKSLKLNIEKTIGIPYEVVIIDNIDNKYSIFSAYNEGVKKSKFEIICFLHEDIILYTQGWGKKVIDHFRDNEVGMIGVAGGMAQSKIPSAWWYNNYFGNGAINILMRKRNDSEEELYRYTHRPLNDEKIESVIIDGLWFCIRKSLFSKISFDETTFKGFHLYDADISMQVQQHAKLFIVYDILLEHKWSGKISKDFYTDLIKFSDKWRSFLPIQNKKINENYMQYYNWHALRNCILEMKTKDFTHEEIKIFLNKYLSFAKEEGNSYWFRTYFFISKIIGYRNANRIFYRLEKLTGFCNYTPGKKSVFNQNQVI